jgi:hypothetical protein
MVLQRRLTAAALVAVVSACTFDGEVIGLGEGGGGGGGAGAPCAPVDCDDANPCTQDRCEAGACVHEPVDAALDDVANDCVDSVCEGGAIVEVADDSEVPTADANPCTEDLCRGGEPTYEPAPGAPCGDGLTCDDQGACIGCLSPTECPGGNACRTATCVDQVCGFDTQPEGTVIPDAPGNCQRTVCSAAGEPVVEALASDAPASDSNPCTIEACSGTTPTVSNAPAGSTVAAENGVGCNGVCQDGAYAGTCGSALYWRSFPTPGNWSRAAVSTVWSGANAPPPTGIVSAEETSTGSRLMVFTSNGNYHEFRGGAWQTPVAATARFGANLASTAISATSTGRFQPEGDTLIITSNENPPRGWQYLLPESGELNLSASPFFVTDESSMPNAPPQHTTPMTWGFGETRAPYPTTPDAHVAWKRVNGLVYQLWFGTGYEYPFAPTPDTTSPLVAGTAGTPPPPSQIVAAFYRVSNQTVYVVAP